jgi:hypothetical protein
MANYGAEGLGSSPCGPSKNLFIRKERYKTLKFISHRGNLFGPNPFEENNPDYVKTALMLLPVEVDCWKVNGSFYLGHNEPKYEISRDFLSQKNLLLHAKNIEILDDFANVPYVEVFWHEDDNYTITSRQRIIYHSRHSIDNSIHPASNIILVQLNLAPSNLQFPSKISILTDYPLGR